MLEQEPLIVRLRERPRQERAAYLQGYIAGLQMAASWDAADMQSRLERLKGHMALIESVMESA